MKYLDVHYHCVRERILAERFVVRWISTHDQLADSVTKALPGPELKAQRERIGLR
jgi:hypothetical protein